MKALLSLFLFSSSLVFAQIEVEEIEIEDSTYYLIDGEDEWANWIEEPPKFPGGESALLKMIQDSVQYPQDSLVQNISGIVYVQFIIGTNGKSRDFKVLRGGSAKLDQEAIRVAKCLPDWEPAIFKNDKIESQYTLPIHFKAQK